MSLSSIGKGAVPTLTDVIEGPPAEAAPPPAPPPAETSSAAEPPKAEPPVSEALPEDVVAAEAPTTAASPVKEAPPIHGDATIRAWFADVFNNLVATGRVRERDAEAYLQDLLKRLGF